MKKLTIAVAFMVCCICGLTAYAEERGYIIELNGRAPLMLMNTDEDITSLGDTGRYFYAESMKDILPYLPYAKNVCRDFELELFDYPEKTNDQYFSDQWNHPVMKTEALRETGLDGSGVRIAVIDSGINIYHEDIDTSKIVYTYDCVSNSEAFESINDTYGHGSFVTGTFAAITNNELGIAGITPNVSIELYRVTSGRMLYVSDLIKSTEMAIAHDCDIINMSLGGPGSWYDEAELKMMSSLVDRAYENNIIVVASGGNYATTEIGNALNYPAAFDSVIGVSSVTSSLERAAASTYNESIFVTAPGENLYGLFSGESDSYKIWSGTSFSTPEVSAAAIVARQMKSDMTPDEFKQLLIDTSVDLGDDGYDIQYGYGLLNFENIVEKLSLLGEIPTPRPTADPTPTTEPTETPEPSATPTMEPTETPKPSATPTIEPSTTPTTDPSDDVITNPTATPTVSPSPTATPTIEPTETPEPSATPTIEPTQTPTVNPSPTPTIEPTETPEPSATPTIEPTETPEPSASPTIEPTEAPAVSPSPTATTKVVPVWTPTPTATVNPTETPKPSATPTAEPTKTPKPSATPTIEPTETPAPSASPTIEPTKTPEPSATPTIEPTETPEPSATPTIEPTETPAPSATPTLKPTETPTATPTATPTIKPTATPTAAPTEKPGIKANAVLTDSSGNSITSLTRLSETKDDVTAKVTVNGLGNRAFENVKVIIAVYAEDGALLGVSMNSMVLSQNNNIASLVLQLPQNTPIGSVKLMLWDRLSNVHPISEASKIL